ncbi:predicted protein [Enterococcus faecium 1,231,501]|nr:predicted protein [Enterococcus faecium 1,231,501]
MERGCDSTVVIASFFFMQKHSETFLFFLLFFSTDKINNNFPAQLFAVFYHNIVRST